MVHNEGTFAFADPQQINIPEVVQVMHMMECWYLEGGGGETHRQQFECHMPGA